MLIAVIVNFLPFNIFHRQPRQTSFRCSTINQACNIWMIKAGKNLPFVPKATAGEISLHPVSDELNGYAFLILLVIAHRQIHRAHPALSKLAHDLIVTDFLPDQGIGFCCFKLRDGLGGGGFNKIFRAFVRSEQGLYFPR